ncbi:MAG: RimK family alpha-L-glutamate ligase [Erythrobacter sp.]|nr:RimK family alpha-L-glutamate ligase [Erythrobacter sp.]
MHGWIIFSHDLDPSIPEVPEVLRFCEVAPQFDMRLSVLKPHHFDIVVGADEAWAVKHNGQPIERPDFILCRTGAETDYFTLALLRHFERRGVRLINGSAAIEMVADKLFTMQRLARSGLPVPRTILGKFPIDSDLVETELGFPVIVKTLRGTRGAGVLKCEDRSQFEDLAGLLSSANAGSEFILQHYVRASHGRDVRLLVVGGRVVAAMERRSLDGGFKSNVSLGGVGEALNPSQEMADLAIRTADALGLDVTGVDILYDEEGYRICEANSAPGFQGLERATGLDIPTIILDWIKSSQDQVAVEDGAVHEEHLVELVFGGRASMRALADGSATQRAFAFATGASLLKASLATFYGAVSPAILRDRRSHYASALTNLYNDRQDLSAAQLLRAEGETAFIAVVGCALWAAILPWLTGMEASVAATLSLLSLLFPIAFLITQPKARPGSRSGRTSR